MKLLARFISVIAHPLLLATYLITLFAWLYPAGLFPIPDRSFKSVLVLIFVCTFLLPAINVYFFKAFGTITSVTMPLRKERIAPFLMITILYLVVTYLLNSKLGLGFQDPIMKFLIIIDLLVLAAFLVTLVMKASIHSLAIAGMTVIIAFLNTMTENGIFFYPFIVSILMLGIISSARLLLQVHRPKEVLVGLITGAGVGTGAMIFLF